MGNTKSGTVSVWTDGEIIAEIDRRAGALSLGRSGYATHVFNWWKSQGFPAVTKADQAMQDIHALERFKAAEDKPAPDSPGKSVRKRAV